MRSTLSFLAAWLALDVVASLRYPASEDPLWYLVPSVDVVVVLALYAAWVHTGRRVPPAVHRAVAAMFVIVRLLRLADGTAERFLSRRFSVFIDFPLVPEFARLAHSTLPTWQFVLACVAAPASLAALYLGLFWALRCAERALETPRNAGVLAGGVVLFALASPFRPRVDRPEWYTGAFAASAAPRVLSEVDSLFHARHIQAARRAAIDETERRLAQSPTDLAKLHGASVLLFFVESYGRTVLDEPDQWSAIRPTYEAFESDLAARGFFLASGLFDSPTYGGGSWLAHATMATGVKTDDQLAYEIALAEKPRTLATLFRSAGYRTLLVEPATVRKWPQEGFYQFEKEYDGRDLGYRGPSFGWAPMPDQYVLDFVERKESVGASRSLFIQYVLVSSHAPWNRQPPLVDDWSSLQEGSIFGRLPAVAYPLTWSNLADGSEAYVRSISYDLEVLRQYIARSVRDDALIIILGDHQPAAEITRRSPEHGVPVHVLSRNRPFVDAFARRGYTPGMRPAETSPHPGLETFLFTFLEDFSTGAADPTR